MTNLLQIAICGLGSAGKSRLKALSQVTHIKLAGIISRRPEHTTLSFEEALQNPNVHAMAISTENTDHASRVEVCLKASKHVLCDYPLAFSAKKARELFDLAQRQKRVLHVEHIGLLTQAHQNAKKEVKIKGPLLHGEYIFQGGWNNKLANKSLTGPYPILAVSRLMQVADLFGAFKIIQIENQKDESGFRLALTLEFKKGGTLNFVEERKISQKRSRSLKAILKDGNLNWQAGVEQEGLFLKDLLYFRDRILKTTPCYYDEGLMIDVLKNMENFLSKDKP